MEAPSARTDREQAAVETLLHVFQDINQADFLRSHAGQLQELEYQIIAVWVGFSLEFAEGAQLDVLGRIVGERRLNRDDDTYRVAIGARVRINRSSGRIEDILAALTSALDLAYRLEEVRAGVKLTVLDSIDILTAEGLYYTLRKAKGAGISASMRWSHRSLDNCLRTATGDTVETSSSRGLANDAGTSGGHLAGYYND